MEHNIEKANHFNREDLLTEIHQNKQRHAYLQYHTTEEIQTSQKQ